MKSRTYVMLNMAIGVLALVIMGLVACAATQLQAPQTPEGKYLAARMEFNKTLQSYINFRQNLTPEQQTSLNAKYRPKFVVVSQALDAWGLAFNTGDAAAQEQAFLAMKNDLLKALLADKIVKE